MNTPSPTLDDFDSKRVKIHFERPENIFQVKLSWTK